MAMIGGRERADEDIQGQDEEGRKGELWMLNGQELGLQLLERALRNSTFLIPLPSMLACCYTAFTAYIIRGPNGCEEKLDVERHLLRLVLTTESSCHWDKEGAEQSTGEDTSLSAIGVSLLQLQFLKLMASETARNVACSWSHMLLAVFCTPHSVLSGQSSGLSARSHAHAFGRSEKGQSPCLYIALCLLSSAEKSSMDVRHS